MKNDIDRNKDQRKKVTYVATLLIAACYTKKTSGGGDVRKFEPKRWLNFATIDKSIQELRAIYKEHPERFEIPKSKLDKMLNAVDYSI